MGVGWPKRPGAAEAAGPQGRGERNAQGLARWYDEGPKGPTWADILCHWQLIEQDLADQGIDVALEVHRQSWRWLSTRILGLLNQPPRVWDAKGRPLPTSRLEWALNPPKTDG